MSKVEHLNPEGLPPAVTNAIVSQLARPDFLVEIDTVAVVPEAS